MINRRDFLKRSFATMGVAGGLATNFASFNAFAADTSDYKALVCVFLGGGMDGHDVLIPYDQSTNLDYENIRERLLSRLDNSPEGYASRRRENLLPLDGEFEGRQFAFPQEMRALQELYNQGDMAVVGNVGPLIEPLIRAQFLSGARRVPPRLGSHNDASSIWMASAPEGARAGWGGRFGDIMVAANANPNATFTSVSAAGRSIFLTGEDVQAFEVDSAGALGVTHLNSTDVLGSNVFASHYDAILRDAGQTAEGLSLYGKDMSQIMGRAIDANSLLNAQLAGSGDPTTIFPTTALGSQFNVIARMIARRQGLGVGRQIFFVKAGGFDTHRNQGDDLPGRQLDVANSMRAFYDAMVELNLADQVTTFTASDFGRTLSVSGSGTDHGWGNHHMVVGGAVNGGQIYGDVPPPAFDHDYDMGRGRLIPKISVDQYAGTLGRWFGLSDGELLDALPAYGNFDVTALEGLLS
jgi:uncharacterized protein (DUF1501 family)